MKAPVSLTSEELLQLLARAKASRLRDWVMILFTYWHGFRGSETVGQCTRLRGTYDNLEKAEACRKRTEGATIRETTRKVKKGRKACYQVLAPTAELDGGLRFRDIEDGEITMQRRKGSEKTTQFLQRHDNPLLDEVAAWEEWLAAIGASGKKGGAKLAPDAAKKHENISFAHPDNTNPDARVFPITRGHFWRLVHRYARECGLPRRKCKTHVLKHSIAMHMVDSGKLSLPAVQMYLGHKSLGSTGVYTLDKEDSVSRAVGKAIRGSSGFAPQIGLFNKDAEK